MQIPEKKCNDKKEKLGIHIAFSSGENPDLAPRGLKPRTFLLGGNATVTTYVPMFPKHCSPMSF